MARLAQHLGRVPEDLDFKTILDNPEHVAQLSLLQSQVFAEQVGNTNIVQITAEAANHEEAKSVANGLADVFAQWSLEEKNRQVIEAKDFIAQQLAQAEGRMKEAEDALQAFMESNIDHLSLSTDEMARLQKEKTEIRQQRTILERQVDQLEARMQSRSGHIDWVSSSELDDSNLKRFNDKLIELQFQREHGISRICGQRQSLPSSGRQH